MAASDPIGLLRESLFDVGAAADVLTSEKHSMRLAAYDSRLMFDRILSVLCMVGFKVEVGGSAITSAVRNPSGQIVAKACGKSL